ncbi:MAG: BREX-4 system phosphatase PglZ [Tannerella sp.]|nr:BREX-4 system phosphatase PglZ [Tannerella sp.]
MNTPFFLFVGDDKYSSVRNDLSGLDLLFLNMSDFCTTNDKVPNFDAFLERLKTVDVNVHEKKIAVFGVGEYLALCGKNETAREISRLKDHNIGNARVILVLRGITYQSEELQKDPRFDKRRFFVVNKAVCELSFTLADSDIGLSGIEEFKALLVKLENGFCGNMIINTAVNIDNALFPVRKISNAYDGIQYTLKNFNLPRSCGNDEQWADLLKELSQNDNSIDKVFDNNGIATNTETELSKSLYGNEYKDWLVFIMLKSNVNQLNNSYLRFAFEKTNSFDELKTNILNAIIEIPHTNKWFAEFYEERKTLLEKFAESDVAAFIINNRQNNLESIYKLTDTTKVEKEEIIKWIAKNGYVRQIDKIYPSLAAYAKNYVFKSAVLDDLLTDYFERYKKQKITNTLEKGFIEKVEELAKNSRVYNRLPSRSEILDNLDNKNESFLCWVDALGVEYLAFIEELAKKRGLSISIKIARAELPTITSINRRFYDTWQTENKIKIEELDETKHKETGGYSYIKENLPIHLVKELDIISNVMDRAATELALRKYKSFLIVSDHGASRLAILLNKKEKYETDTKGEHSGRCCKMFTPYDLPYAAEENGFLVLADYGRFSGSRAANVEVHGGASLEEVVVPIIELKLKNDNIRVKLIDEIVTVDFRTGTEITLFFNAPIDDVSIIINKKRYSGIEIDDQHFKVKLPDTKRAGEYDVEVYSSDNLIGTVRIKAQGKSGKINDSFDNLFGG